ncbi:MAG: HAD family phosphatase [Candidatus Altiarchaeota archaeon]|nr:HAD family phosphatase [Candidatus Altiarchaeota archaeon]
MKAVIFDMDGVLANTQKIHARVESELFKEIGINLSPRELTRRFSGMDFKEQVKVITKETGIKVDFKKFSSEKYSRYVKELEKGIDEVKGAVKLVQWLYSRGVPIVIATSNHRIPTQLVIERLGLSKFIKNIVTGEDIENGKPSPDIFLKSASIIETEPVDCVVIEDGVSGIEGAKKAGMISVGFGSDVKSIGDFSANTMNGVRCILKELFAMS